MRLLFEYLLKATIVLGILAVLSGCGKDNPSFSVLPDGKTFKQSNSSFNNKLDILWVVDNSGSMDPIQSTLTAAFNSFIQGFVARNYDFHMAVTNTQAYLAGPTYLNQPNYARFSDGVANHTGVFVMTNSTPNLASVFVTNATQGSNGSGDERAFQSFKETLTNSVNTPYGFRRPDAYFTIIIVSDEDDFSNFTRPQGGGSDHNYNQANIWQINDVVTWLDTYTASTAPMRKYNVSSIHVKDIATCRPSIGSIQGIRYQQLVNATDGLSGSVCDNTYDAILADLNDHISELSTQFFLDRTPVPGSITVLVNNVFVPESATNGWTYNATSNSIIFHGSAIPPQGATIQVNFQPLTAR